MFQAKFDEAKYLTLGVGAVNVTFTLVAVSTNFTSEPPLLLLCDFIKKVTIVLMMSLYWLLFSVDVRHKL